MIRGLIYKENSVFYKSVDRKLLFIAGVAIILLIGNSGIYAGLLASIMLALTIGMQNIMCFSLDEKTDWKKYQMAMPVSGFQAVAGKYLSVLCTLSVSLLGSLALNLLPCILFRTFDRDVWKLSLICAVMIPLVWTGVCLPITYWFGFHSAQIMGFLVFIPMFYLIKYFEDGPGFSQMAEAARGCLPVIGAGLPVLYGLSMLISIPGYERRK